ncbi:MAG: hypothetical protein HQM10_20185 [Candidatus Riflebacteria bacterium]|nr:hypothetical protein [Candidatus Riflebacteria bacterium]
MYNSSLFKKVFVLFTVVAFSFISADSASARKQRFNGVEAKAYDPNAVGCDEWLLKKDYITVAKYFLSKHKYPDEAWMESLALRNRLGGEITNLRDAEHISMYILNYFKIPG